MREVKFEILFEAYSKGFTKKVLKHYTSISGLINGDDDFDYSSVNIIAKRQLTGLQDKNGVDIYEGDIIKRDLNCFFDDGTVNEVVNFSGGQFNSSDSCLDNVVTSFKAVVIGNIHENPELLELNNE